MGKEDRKAGEVRQIQSLLLILEMLPLASAGKAARR
jgi:hypothetical protein